MVVVFWAGGDTWCLAIAMKYGEQRNGWSIKVGYGLHGCSLWMGSNVA